MTANPVIHYRLSAPDPRSHYFHVQVRFTGDLPEDFQIALPVWTPGSYLIREYARHLINLQAYGVEGPMAIRRIDKASWDIALGSDCHDLTVEYDVYAYELTVRNSYLDKDYGLVSPTSVFVYHPDLKMLPCTLTIVAPEGWDVATGLARQAQGGEYAAPNYDILADSPIQMGQLFRHPFDVDGMAHELVVAGPVGELLPRADFLKDLSKIIDTAKGLFGSLPYDHYTFLVTITENGGGGLEHLNSANIMVSPQRWQSVKDYPKLLSLFAHEFFHLWNVKRLRPSMLGPFNYQSEVYTSLLWVLEGVTDYFAYWLLGQSQVVSADEVLDHWAELLYRYEQLPGRWVTPVAEASREAWIREYRPDANTPNITVSYYLKGALVGLFLDLELRRHSYGVVNLAGVMGELWRRYGDRGYPENAVEDLVVEMGGKNMSEYLKGYVHGRLPFDESVFEGVGLKLERQFKVAEGERPAWLGLWVVERQGRLYARSVEREGSAELGGISPDDEILAVDGERVTTAEQWQAALCRIASGQTVAVVIAHRGRVEAVQVVSEAPRCDQYVLRPVVNPTEDQAAAFQSWCGVALGASLPKDAQ